MVLHAGNLKGQRVNYHSLPIKSNRRLNLDGRVAPISIRKQEETRIVVIIMMMLTQFSSELSGEEELKI